MITEQQVLAALSQVHDPDLGKDLVSLRMIQDLQIEGKKIRFRIVLTTPACPVKDAMQQACINAIHMMVDPEAEVEIQMDAQTTSRRQDNKVILPEVSNIIAVASGKGGVGKSTISTNLALAIAQRGAKVGLMDADIYGPSMPIMLGIKGERPRMAQIKGRPMIVPMLRFGIEVMSIGLLVDEKQAVIWRGPMASSAVRQFMTDIYWGALDYLIIDLPPGTGDIHLTLVQQVPLTGAIVVTTPQDVALADARKALGMFNTPQIKVPVIGVVENMAYFTPPDLPDRKYYLFGRGGGQKLAEEFGVPFLGQIPIVENIREGGDIGVPAMVSDDEISRKAFESFADQAIRSIARLNASLQPA
ncbi:ATP-binding protein involved in chromosome partitioning [Thermoflavifilum aggregans]|uniref:Iron-sulfur cluster carrier protein n=1 Tax=Thermoflavifilum aggregans TaxID=454188 RepID=A0A2M9CVP8_9BACT|nr:Mrp/NBP35 family ATP-binding protein [Thermoflavifilum aggregans]PJJ75868.1 ATP-binding protein involved in chromosome partitioning [Thermoflavifilum aggregans]